MMKVPFTGGTFRSRESTRGIVEDASSEAPRVSLQEVVNVRLRKLLVRGTCARVVQLLTNQCEARAMRRKLTRTDGCRDEHRSRV